MKHYCKLCNYEMLFINAVWTFAPRESSCACHQGIYTLSLYYNEDNSINHQEEYIILNNYCFHYNSSTRIASILKQKFETSGKHLDGAIINIFHLDELTTELAAEWLGKLKTYSIFE